MMNASERVARRTGGLVIGPLFPRLRNGIVTDALSSNFVDDSWRWRTDALHDFSFFFTSPTFLRTWQVAQFSVFCSSRSRRSIVWQAVNRYG